MVGIQWNENNDCWLRILGNGDGFKDFLDVAMFAHYQRKLKQSNPQEHFSDFSHGKFPSLACSRKLEIKRGCRIRAI